MKRFLLVLVAALVMFTGFAAPAYRKPFTVKQSDGTVLTVVLSGDEALHFYATADGKPLVKETNGDFSYATFSNGAFVSTKQLAHDSASRGADELALLSSIDYEAMKADISKAGNARSATYRAAAQRAGSQIVPEGDVNIAVVLVQFKDVKFTYTKEDINNVLNTEGYKLENPFAKSVGSARDYFIAQSDGKFRPNFMVTDIVTLDNDMSYYGGNDANDEDKKAAYAVKEGIQKADATFDFSKCDNDGDGEVEFVYCIYAGYSESYGADENTIWPHQWEMSAQAGLITVDRVKCNTYACSGELVYNEDYESEIGKVLAGIGLICHEFSHCLGLHDIYDTTYESGNWCMDYWDVMDQGNYAAEGYVPVGYSAYQRDFCGWRDLVVLDEKGSYSMPPLTQGGVAYKVVNDANSNEYYIFENRKQESWDTYLFNSGMLVIHVDYNKTAWDNNEINTKKNHPRYTIIPADNELAVYGEVSNSEFSASLKGDVWPGTSGNTELTNTSIPAAKVYTGGFMNKPVTNIAYKDDVISFDFMSGVFAGVPKALEATDVTETSFVANWEPLEDAGEYAVELYRITEAANGMGDAVSILSEDFLDFTETNEDVSSTIDDYTSVSGWDGYKIYSEGGILRVGTANNGGFVTTPTLEVQGSVAVLFSSKLYNVNDTGAKLIVSIKQPNGVVVASKEVVPTSDLVNYTLTATVNGKFYVEFSTTSSTGKKRADVDNIVVSTTSPILSEKVTSIVTDKTSHLFDGLDTDSKYRYRVQARDEYGSSEFSDYVVVSLLSTGIDEIIASDGAVEVYAVSGVKLYGGDAGSMPALKNGVYVVVTPSGTRKMFIR